MAYYFELIPQFDIAKFGSGLGCHKIYRWLKYRNNMVENMPLNDTCIAILRALIRNSY